MRSRAAALVVPRSRAQRGNRLCREPHPAREQVLHQRFLQPLQRGDFRALGFDKFVERGKPRRNRILFVAVDGHWQAVFTELRLVELRRSVHSGDGKDVPRAMEERVIEILGRVAV